MTEYPKINTIYNRAMDGTKKLIPGDFRDETVRFLKDLPWIMTEKIDGTNIGVVWDGHQVTFQGRTERAQIPAKLISALMNLFGGNDNEELFEQKFGEMPVILFGEGYGPGIQNGGRYRTDVSFILFDVYLPEQNLWLKRDSVEDIATSFHIDVVPVVKIGTLEEAVDIVRSHPKSNFGTAPMEGLVCRPQVDLLDRQGQRIIVKVKVRDFD